MKKKSMKKKQHQRKTKRRKRKQSVGNKIKAVAFAIAEKMLEKLLMIFEKVCFFVKKQITKFIGIPLFALGCYLMYIDKKTNISYGWLSSWFFSIGLTLILSNKIKTIFDVRIDEPDEKEY